MKTNRIILVAVFGLALLLQGCAVYPAYGYRGYGGYYGYRPYYYGYGYRPYAYRPYVYRPYVYRPPVYGGFRGGYWHGRGGGWRGFHR